MAGTEEQESMEEGVAIIGIACRFPDARNVDEFWKNLCAGRESVRDLTDDDLRAAGIDPSVRADPHYVGRGVVLEDVDLFDAEFFGFNPRDAEVLDPQQRLFLECAWEALEAAGYDPAHIDVPVGVYGGADMSSYLFNLVDNADVASSIGSYAISLGNDKDHLTTRTAYKLNLKGPAVTIQTACSTSLVAVVQACKDLLYYQCDMAIAGGSSVAVPQGTGYLWQPGGIQSPDGHCRAFDAGAQGTISGSGAGMVVLKRHSEALADGDPIYAVIRGFGVNNDGSGKVGYTAPSIAGQSNAILTAMLMAGFDPETIGYVEAHGTGTVVGDPIEIAALTQAYRGGTSRRQYCGIGSVKTNFGHLNSAAGIAGLIKTVLALHHRTLPPSLHFEKPNPDIRFEDSPFYVVERLQPWEANGSPRRAGVSSFGIGGTNTHVVLEEVPPAVSTESRRPWHLLPVSAKSTASLDKAVVNLNEALAAGISIADAAHTLQTGRARFAHRRVLLASQDGAKEWVEGEGAAAERPVVFLFPGQGVQHAGMGRELYDSEPLFRQTVDECCAILRKDLGFDLREVLFAEGASQRLTQTAIAQPALFVIEYALAKLLMHWGVRPDAMAGHSVGEYVAACLAGVIELEDCLHLIAARGALMQSTPAGAMTAVHGEAREFAGSGLSVAAVNGPALCVLSGSIDAIEQFEASFGGRCKRLQTSHAFHSTLMDGIIDPFVARMARVRLSPPQISYLSNLTGTWITSEQATDPRYWGRHLRETVQFARNLETLHDGVPRILVEVGPGRTLSTLAQRYRNGVRQYRNGAWPLALKTLANAGAAPVARTLASLWANGIELDWSALRGNETRRRIALPTYPFDRKRYWISAKPAESRSLPSARAAMRDWFSAPVWQPASRPAVDVSKTSLVLRGADFSALQVASAVERIVYWSDGSLSSLVALAKVLPSHPLELCVITTQGARISSRERLRPEQAMLAAAVKVIVQELTNVRARVIDVPADPGQTLLRDLESEIASGAGEPAVALRESGRWTIDYEPLRLNPASAARRLRDRGVYVITGGFGGIGLSLALHLAQKVSHPRLVLISRSPVSEGALARIEEMKAAGAEVWIERADVSDERAMQAVAVRVRERFGAVNGVIHAAGIAGGGVIALRTEEQMARVLAAKVDGTRIVHEIFGGDALDFLVLCSSLSAIVGGIGQIDYAAANAFLDAFAQTHAGDDTLVVSVNWDTWAEVGMASRADRESPANAITPAEGGLVLDHVLGGTVAQVIVSTTDIHARVHEFQTPAALHDLAPKALSTHARPQLSTPYVAPRDETERTLASLWSELLGMSPVGIDDDFLECGGHSLLAIQLIAQVREAFRVEIPIAALFQQPTIAELAARIRGGAAPARARLLPRARPERIPLSYAQARLWFLHRLEGASSTYNIVGALRLKGKLDAGAMTAALADVVARHESLRTIFPDVDGTPHQQILPPGSEVPVTVGELDEASLHEAMARAAASTIELTREIPLRAWLYRLHADEHVLIVLLHHIAGDAWSMGPFWRDLAAAYVARREGRSPDLAPLPLQYADYALWQRDTLGDENDPDSVMARQLGFWRSALEGAPEELSLPADRPRPLKPAYRGAIVPIQVGARVHGLLADLCKATGATLFMALQTALAVLLSKLGAGDDIPIGSPVAGRGEHGLEGLIGFFVNTLVFRTDVSGRASFRSLLERTRTFDLQAFDHQDVPFDRVVEALQPERALNRHPLFQVLLVVQNASGEDVDLGGLEVSPESPESDAAKFDLTVRFAEELGPGGEPSGLSGGLEFSFDLFDRATAESMAARFLRLLEQVVTAPDLPVTAIDILQPTERRALLEESNATAHAVPETTLVALFEAQAAERAEGIAVQYGAESVTYGELNARANRVAHALMARGIGPERVVAVLMPPSIELVVTLLGVLKSGAAFLPLDPEHPQSRTARILADADPDLVLAADPSSFRVPCSSFRVASGSVGPNVEHGTRNTERETAQLDGPDRNPTDAERVAPLRPAHPAYVIYTSGSTGTPKGVQITHESPVNYVHWLAQTIGLGPRDGTALVSSVAYDLGYTGLFGALMTGGRLVLVPAELRRDPRFVLQLLRERGLTWLKATPSYLAMLLAEEESLGNLQTLLLGGEPQNFQQLRRLLQSQPQLRLINHYGPTETTIGCVAGPMDDALLRADAPPQRIGLPVWNTRAYVLDSSLEPVPIGIAGELYVAGAGLARGYYGRAALTAERFVADPYGAVPGARMYRTGDRARRLADGSLEFLGRADQQIKIRGFRIEPGEIEAAILAEPAVAQAAVLAHQGADALQLVAYVVGESGATPDVDAIRRALTERLPDYMVPAAFVVLDALPFTPNGKLDRRGLPDPQFRSDRYRAPRSPEEEILCGIFADVLAVQRVGIDDDFFSLGGHSLMATRLVSRVRAALGTELAIRTLFEAPTVAKLAGRLRTETAVRLPLVPQEWPRRIPLSYAQQRLWFLYRLDGVSATYNIPAGFRLEGELDVAALEAALLDVVERHQSLRTRFPEEDGVPYQEILSTAEGRPRLIIEDVTEAELPARLSEAAITGIDLATETPMRVWLYRVVGVPRSSSEVPRSSSEVPRSSSECEVPRQPDSPEEPRGTEDPEELTPAPQHVLMLLIHHIVSDGWSSGPLMMDLAAAYAARRAGEAPRFAELPVHYADYALWQRRLLGEETDPDSLMSRQLEFWRKALAGIPEDLELPADRPRPNRVTYRGDVVPVPMSADLHGRLLALARSAGASLFIVMQAGFATLLSRLGAGSDIPIGTAIAGRADRALEELIGLFVNTLVLRADLSGNPTFRELIARVRAFDLDAYAHQDVPFERVVEAAHPTPSLSRHPIFQVAMTLHNTPRVEMEWPGLTLDFEPVAGDIAKFDLMLRLIEDVGLSGEPQGIIGSLEYSEDRFDRATADRLAERLVRLLEHAVQEPDVPLSRLAILTAKERETLLETFNASAPATHPEPFIAIFERQVARDPHAIAVITGEELLSYGELNRRANQFAHELIAQRLGPDDLIGLRMPRSADMIVAILGAWKAGVAYLPLDASHPEAHLAQIVEDARPRRVLTSANVPGTRPVHDPTDADRIAPLLESHAAYVIYTSGSTGRPKGVVVTHAGIARLAAAQAERMSIAAGSRVLQFASFTFDASVSEIVMTLISGATLVVATEDERAGAALSDLLIRQAVTHATIPPIVLATLEDADRLPLQALIVAGEACPPDLVAQWSPRLRMFNAYGPTETTVCATMSAPLAGGSTPPIGTPLPNTRVYVLDAALEPVPVGSRGELYVSGPSLARGYLDRAALTAERFVADPYSAEPGTRMYRTGDLARWRVDGTLEFLGRVDEQLKIRGNRVEPGAVEAALRAVTGVREAAVVPVKGHDGSTSLAAYYAPDAKLELWPSIAEFYVYDELVYSSMANDEYRNDKYRAAFAEHLKGKVVVEIGPGPFAILSRLAVEAGARHVYAIELNERSYLRARQFVADAGLSERITLLHGDARDVELPQAADWCVSEIVGTIGGSEGSAVILNDARRLLRDPSHMLPMRSVTRIAACALPETLLHDGFSDTAAAYVERIFADVGRPFDLRICVKGAGRRHLLTGSDIFEDLDYTREMPVEETHPIELEVTQPGAMTGFLLWLTLEFGNDDPLDILDHQDSWLPVYVSAFPNGVELQQGDRIRATIERTLCANGLNPDFRITGIVERNGVTLAELAVDVPHVAATFRGTPFYARLFAGESIPRVARPTAASLRQQLVQTLPSYAVPSWFIELDALPVTSSGKLDRRALPAPERGAGAARPPRNAAEEALCAIFAEVLAIERVGADESFFGLGGNSLLAVRLVARVRAVLGADLSVRDVFETPTVEGLAGRGIGGAPVRETVDRPDLAREAVLPADIDPAAAAPPARPIDRPANVLLTGATGFLGAFLLCELLDRTDANVHCLVRAASAEEAMRRIQKTLSEYGLTADASRIVALPGSLEEPLLGLSAATFGHLAQTIDAIYHNGASVSFVAPYAALKASNVNGTLEIIRLASRGMRKPVHYVSTLGVWSNLAYLDRVIREDGTMPLWEGLHGGYEQTKWVSESLLMAARERGLPVRIYRPARIGGHSVTGVCHTGDFFFSQIKGSIQLGCVVAADSEVNLAPVDYVSRGIVYLSLQEEAGAGVHHFYNPRTVNALEITSRLEDLGYSLRRVSSDQWLHELEQACARSSENALASYLPLFERKVPQLEPGRKPPEFDCRKTEELLAAAGITCPPASELIERSLQSMIETGYLPTPSMALGAGR